MPRLRTVVRRRFATLEHVEATGPSRGVDGVPVFPDYHGPGEDVIVFRKRMQ